MEKQHERTATRIGAYTTLLGSICMLGGAALFGFSGADLDLALDKGDLAGYLTAAHASQTLLIANLSIWILGVILLGGGATMMVFISGPDRILGQLIRYNYGVAIPLVVVAYVAWLAVVVRLAPANEPPTASVAEAMGWFASRADWIATILVLGVGPCLLAIAGRDSWAPGWLRGWGFLALFTGLLNLLAMYAGGLTTYGFLIIPVGMGWMVATSVVLFRRL